MKVIFSLFFIFLYCKQSAANDLWTIAFFISKYSSAFINVRIDSLDINYKRYKDLVLSEVFFDAKKYPLGLIDTNNFKFNYEDNKINLIGELTIKGKSQNIPINIEVIKLASELVQVKSEISFSRNDFKIGTGNWKNTTILKDKIKIKANIFLFKE